MSLSGSGLENLPVEIFTIFDCALEGVMIVDANCVIRYLNPAYFRMTGMTVEERIGQRLRSSSNFGPLKEAVTSGKQVYGRRYHPSGSKAELIVNASPIIVDGQIKGGVSFCQDITDILMLTEKLAKSNQLVQSLTEKLASLGGAHFTFDDIVGQAPAIQEAARVAKKAARGSSTVLLLGESGTGKELFAQAIHNAGDRYNKPFLKVNCAAIPEGLMESEFFGYEKGAFTSASSRKIGLFERADGGTLFLDEIGDMSPTLQAKVLRVLQDGEVTRLGGWRTIRVDVRVIAATNRNLVQMTDEGKFRRDLFFRLNVMSINLPPLRECREDIQQLSKLILQRISSKLGRRISKVDSMAMKRLCAYSWPGNVRELENVLERAVNLVEGHVITSESLLLPDTGLRRAEPLQQQGKIPSLMPLVEQERRMIQQALEIYGNSVEGKRKAASALGISLATLYKRLKFYKQL